MMQFEALIEGDECHSNRNAYSDREEREVARLSQLVLKDYYDIDETVDKDDKLATWANIQHENEEDSPLFDSVEVEEDSAQTLEQRPLMRLVERRPFLEIQLKEEQLAKHNRIEGMQKDDTGKSYKDIPKYTRNSFLDFLYRRTNIANYEARLKELDAIDHYPADQQELTAKEIQLIRTIKREKSVSYAKLLMLFGYDFGCKGRFSQAKEADRIRLWGEESLNSNQAIVDNLLGEMNFSNKLFFVRKRNKIWNYATQPEKCSGLL